MSAAFNFESGPMSKNANRFERSSGWTSRPGGGAEKKGSGRVQRRDLSGGTRRMSDGGNEPQAAEVLETERRRQQLRLTRADEDAARKARKMQLLRKFRQWRAAGELDEALRCPLCREVIPTVDFERHVKDFSGHHCNRIFTHANRSGSGKSERFSSKNPHGLTNRRLVWTANRNSNDFRTRVAVSNPRLPTHALRFSNSRTLCRSDASRRCGWTVGRRWGFRQIRWPGP
jgi:hypothetical protein